MANIKSQIKRNRQNEKRRMRNRATRSDIRTHVRAVREDLAEGEVDETTLRAAIKRIDKGAQKGVVHKNTAARQKSRLIRAARG